MAYGKGGGKGAPPKINRGSALNRPGHGAHDMQARTGLRGLRPLKLGGDANKGGGKGKGGGTSGSPLGPYLGQGRALAQSEYGPTIHTDLGQIGVNERRSAAAEKLAAQYFQSLGRFTTQSSAQEKGISADLARQLAGIGQQTSGQIGQIIQGAVSGLNAYTPGNDQQAPAGPTTGIMPELGGKGGPFRPARPSDTQTGNLGQGPNDSQTGSLGGLDSQAPGRTRGLQGGPQDTQTPGRSRGLGLDPQTLVNSLGLRGPLDQQRGALGDVQRPGGLRGLMPGGLDSQTGRLGPLDTQTGHLTPTDTQTGHLTPGPPGKTGGFGPGHVGGGGGLDGPQPLSIPGADVNPSALNGAGMQALTHQLTLLHALNAMNTGAYRQTGALQGGNYRGLAASNVGTYASSGQQELGQIAQAGRLANEPLIQQIAALRAKQGALAIADAVKLKQQAVTNNLTRQGLGLKSQALKDTAKYNQGRLALSKAEIIIRAKESAASNALGWANLSERKRQDLASNALTQASINQRAAAAAKSGGGGGGGGAKPLSTTSNNTLMTLMAEAYAAAKAGKHVPEIAGGNVSRKSGGNVPAMPQAVAEAGWELAHYGEITQTTLARLHSAGMHDITWNGRHIKVRTTAKPFPGKGFTG